MKLNELSDNFGASKSRRRVGRGIGSGKGKTSGKGHKGAKARSGVSIKGFEGGQMPIYRRLPKRGFVNIFRIKNSIVNIGRIQSSIDSGKIDPKQLIDLSILKNLGFIRSSSKSVRLLSKGSIKSSINIKVNSASKSAIDAVEKAGGKVDIEEIKNQDVEQSSTTETKEK
tara:strand:- start:327 stop:836 length:510 start_codon:yes stop_codon:yes gene_type:complete